MRIKYEAYLCQEGRVVKREGFRSLMHMLDYYDENPVPEGTEVVFYRCHEKFNREIGRKHA